MEKRTQQGKLTNLEIASFCSEMAMILKSGISSLEGVDLLREDAQTKAEKELLDEIYQSVMIRAGWIRRWKRRKYFRSI